MAAKFERSRVMTRDTSCITPVAPSLSMHVAFLLHCCRHTQGSVHGYVTFPPSGGCVETSETQTGPSPKLSVGAPPSVVEEPTAQTKESVSRSLGTH